MDTGHIFGKVHYQEKEFDVNQPPPQKKERLTKRRLGEYLINSSLITSNQLEEAIEYQCIYGGRLGTSLIELGLIEEDQMARALSRLLKLNYIKPELLMDVAKTILNLIPAEIALKYQVVPYHKKGNKLYVALKEASDLKLLDELSFKLNHVIIPLAIPEVRLKLALKKHYGMTLSPRFETLSAQLQRRNLAAQKINSLPPQNGSFSPQKTQSSDNTATLGDESTWPLLGDGDEDFTEVDQRTNTDQAEIQTEQPDRFADLLEKMVSARGRDDIGRAIIAFVRTEFPDCGLFVIRSEVASGWLSSKNSQAFDQLQMPLAEDSICRMVRQSQKHVLGTMIDTPQNLKILEFFHTQLPQNALALPLMVQNRLVSILYIQGELDQLQNDFAALNLLVNKAEMAFKLLILKNKILTI